MLANAIHTHARFTVFKGETMMSIRHTNLLIFYGAGTMADNRPFMVTEFMALGSLKHVLADPDQALDWGVRIRIAAQVAGGVAYLHSLKIVHRDLKSDNVLLNEQLDAKVADFGTSKLVTASRAPPTGPAQLRRRRRRRRRRTRSRRWWR